MLSWRLWRTIADVDIHDPIFRRVSQNHKPAEGTAPRRRSPKLAWPIAALATAVALMLAPQLLALVFVVPIMMIMAIVAAPIYLPLVIWIAGARFTGEVISGVYRERHQYTYDLICASTQGKLNASWSFASGILYRGATFTPLRWGTFVSLRFGLAALALLALFALLFIGSTDKHFGAEELRMLLLPVLLLTAYITNLTQTFVTSQIIGLLASSFDWAKRDALLVGLLVYVMLGALPLAVAGLVYFAFAWFVVAPHPLASMAVETAALLLIIAGRELTIWALWSALKRRMNSRMGAVGRGEGLRRGAAWGVT
ncbi:MAG: hypothetical protein OXG85_13005 [Chloroflexi bacterium]|nr:hypothetical protein [Chloroflexota bacterium]